MNKQDLLNTLKTSAAQIELSTQDEVEPLIYEEAQRLSYLISMTQAKAVDEAIRDHFEFDELDVFLDGKVTPSGAVTGLFYLLANTEPLAGKVDFKSVGFRKFNHLSEKDDATLTDEMKRVRLSDDPYFYYLFENTVKVSDTETKVYSVIPLLSRELKTEVGVMIAQSWYGGTYDEDEKSFSSGDAIVQEYGEKEISRSEYDTLVKLSVANNEISYEKLKESCNMDEVEAGMEYYLD